VSRSSPLAFFFSQLGTYTLSVLAMIDRFNYVSGWVATQVCFTEKPRDRIKLVAKLISVAYQLKILNNFNGLMAVVSGLNRSTFAVFLFIFFNLAGNLTECGFGTGLRSGRR
jgi:hypothetical protein